MTPSGNLIAFGSSFKNVSNDQTVMLTSPSTPGTDGSDFDNATTSAVGPALSFADANATNIVQIQIKNSFGFNTSLTNFTKISAEISSTEMKQNGHVAIAIVNATTGLFNISFFNITWGKYSLAVKLNGSHVLNSPFLIKAAIPCPQSCKNGACKDDGVCACQLGYTGNSCESQIPLTSARFDSANGLVAIVLGIISACSCLLASIMIWVYRNKKIVRASSPPLQLVIGFGLFIWSFYPIFSTLAFSNNVPCYAAPVVFHLGFTIAFTTILIKNIRILLIFSAGYQ